MTLIKHQPKSRSGEKRKHGAGYSSPELRVTSVLLEHVLDDCEKWYCSVEGVDQDPHTFSAERAERTRHTLLGALGVNFPRVRVVLTDIGDTSREFAAEQGLAFTDMLNVAIARPKYRCVVLTGD